MQGKSLRIYSSDKTFFSKLTNTLTRLLIPTKIGINGVLISIKRNTVLKNYEIYIGGENLDSEKRSLLEKKFEESYNLYLDAIDKNIIDSIYKKVKNGSATDFEKEALSKYYMIVNLKDEEFTEYKYRKQKYLLEIDYEVIKNMNKQKSYDKFINFYTNKMESIYKSILKNYSVKLADNLTLVAKDGIYDKIFKTLEEYIANILPLKFQNTQNEYKDLINEYEKFERFTVGKLDQNETIEKNMVLLGISRKIFTHSIPLSVAEQCYVKLLKDLRSLIVDTRIVKKQQRAYELLLRLIEEFSQNLLSTKIYWDKYEDKQEYRKFWDQYTNIQELKKTDLEEYVKQKEILFLKSELRQVQRDENKYCKIIKFYKEKLAELGCMRKLKNRYNDKIIFKRYKRIKSKRNVS